MNNITLSEAEIAMVTEYKRPADQLAELHRQGFYRARRSRTTGHVILEREHYLAVCQGAAKSRTADSPPRVRLPQLRTA